MALPLMLLLSPGSPRFAHAQTDYDSYTFTPFAGPDESPGWFDGLGEAARFSSPYSAVADTNGNLYLANMSDHTIRKITPGGQVTTLAGLAGYAGTTNATGNFARFNNPSGMGLDAAGNVYVADSGNHAIRKITPAGAVTTLAGMPGVSGTNNGTGGAARFNTPRALTVDRNGFVYVADTSSHTIRKITPAGDVTILAGIPLSSGTNNGAGSSARFYGPCGVTVDANTNVFVADTYNHTIRRITAAGTVSILAGRGTVSGTNNGTGTAARFDTPFGVAADTNGNVLVADTFNHTVRKVTAAGVVTNVAGGPGILGFTNGTGNGARFNFLTGVAPDRFGNVYVADYGNNLVRKVSPAAVVSTHAGTAGGSGTLDGTGTAARFNYPADVTVDPATNFYVADLANHTIRKITAAGVVTTLAGLGGTSGTNNGSGTAARFDTPTGLAAATNGDVYVADSYNSTIRRVTSAGAVSLFAGLGKVPGTNNGTGTAARFNVPFGVAMGTNTTLYVADTYNHAIRKITSAGVVTTLAGNLGQAGTNDGVGPAAGFYLPTGVAADTNGNVFVADMGNHAIRKVAPDGTVTTLAGAVGTPGFADGTGGDALFYIPFKVALDGAGNVYVAEYLNAFSGIGNHTIRRISPGGVVKTLGGSPGLWGSANGSGLSARFNSPEGLVVGPDNLLYVADAGNHAIRRGYPAPPDLPVVDLPLDRPGALRQLDLTNLTTTTWAWSVVRQPSPSVSQLSSTTIRNPTFTPDLVEYYMVRVKGTNTSGQAAIGMVELAASGEMLPRISAIRPQGGNVVLTGLGGAPGASYSVLVSSNAAVPLGAWGVLPGSTFNNDGGFNFTNAAAAPAYFRLRVP